MQKLITVISAVLIALISPASAQSRACPPVSGGVGVDFEPSLVPSGTEYGAPVGNFFGQVVLATPDHIQMAVDPFKFTGPGAVFNVARIETAPIPFGTGESIRTNGINLLFDFSGVGFVPQQVRLEFMDLGGTKNIAVNGGVIFAGELSAAPSPMGGVTLAVSTMPVPPPTRGSIGTVTLTGPVISLKIGGLEFWVDNVCAFPRAEKR